MLNFKYFNYYPTLRLQKRIIVFLNEHMNVYVGKFFGMTISLVYVINVLKHMNNTCHNKSYILYIYTIYVVFQHS